MNAPTKLLTLAALILLAATLPAQDPVAASFVAGLNQKCPTRNLQYLPDDDLNYQVKLFEISLTQTQDQEFTRAARKACAKSTSGLTCSNEAFLKVAEHDHFLDHFVDYLCAQPTTCTAAGKCTPIK